MQFTCPHCFKTYRGKPENEGRKIRCKECEEPFVIEADDEGDTEDDDFGAPPPRPTKKGKKQTSKKVKKKAKSKSSADDETGGEEDDEASPLQMMIGGVVLIAIGVGLYFWLDHAERTNGRVHTLIYFVYSIIGKTGILVVSGLLGILCLVLGIVDMTKGDE